MTNVLASPHEAIGASRASVSFRTSTDDRLALAEWKALDQGLQNPYLSCSWDWVETWVQVYGRLLPHRYLIGRVGNETVGMALLVEGAFREGPFPVRTLHLGTAGEPVRDSVCVEYNRSLIATEHRRAFVAGLWQHIEDDQRWDRLHFDGLADDIASVVLAGRVLELQRAPCHYFDLAAARREGCDVLTKLGTSTRRNIKQNQKQLGPLVLDWSETVAEADAIFSELIELHQARWTADGEHGCYASELFTRFHRTLIQRLVPQKKLILTRARCERQTLGCVQLFVEDNRLLFYQCGSARLDAKLSPGLMADYLSIQAGLERGYDAYDFLAGDTVHKRKLSTHAREVVWATYRRPRWRFRAAEVLRAIKRRIVGAQPKDREASEGR